jgi:hypothetical protein
VRGGGLRGRQNEAQSVLIRASAAGAKCILLYIDPKPTADYVR